MTCDYRDAAIEALADDEAAALDRIIELAHERDAWRRIALVAIEHLRAAYLERERAGETIVRLRDEYRHLRAQTMRRSMEAA